MKTYSRVRLLNIAKAAITATAMLGFLFTTAPAFAVAQPQDPANCTSNGVGISITVYRSDGTTVIGAANRVKDGETIKYKATLFAAPFPPNCAFQGGTWSITTPDGVSHDVTPGGGVPEIGGAGVSSLDSALLSYNVLHANESVAHVISATTAYSGFSRDGADSAVNAGTGISRTVAHAKISITPNGTNEITKTHTFTGHIDVDPGSGFVNADNGTVVHFSIASGPGSLTPVSGDCTTAGGTGSCTIDLTSATPGVTVVNASSNATSSSGVLFGTTIPVTTDGLNGDSGSATKTWVDANIQLTPLSDRDPINDNHVLTAHVNVNTGTGGYVSAPDGTVVLLSIVSGPGSFTTTNPCVTSGGTGNCSVTLTSPTVGTTTIMASTTPVIGGVSVHRQTGDSKGTDSVNAEKGWFSNTVSMTTTIHGSNGTDHNPVTTVPAGSSVHDSATLTFSGPVPTGNVTFEFYTGPGTSACVEGTPVSAGSAAINGSGVADPSSVEGPLAVGQYYFEAHWAGDSNYPNGATSDCEPLTVTPKQPTISTTLSATSVNTGTAVHDSATLSGATASAGGSATYTVYTNNTCTLGAQSAGTKTVTNSLVPDSDPLTFNSAGTFYWQVVYSGDGNNLAATSTCQSEILTVNQPAGQYCSPGYWKQSQHFDSYVTYHPTDLFNTVFAENTFPGMTLVQVLSQGGGGINALGRAIVGALLNATSINSGFTAAQVIQMFQDVYPGTKDAYNNLKSQLELPENCPLN